MELARDIAATPLRDKDLQKKLWLMIAKHVIKQEDDIGRCFSWLHYLHPLPKYTSSLSHPHICTSSLSHPHIMHILTLIPSHNAFTHSHPHIHVCTCMHVWYGAATGSWGLGLHGYTRLHSLLIPSHMHSLLTPHICTHSSPPHTEPCTSFKTAVYSRSRTFCRSFPTLSLLTISRYTVHYGDTHSNVLLNVTLFNALSNPNCCPPIPVCRMRSVRLCRSTMPTSMTSRLRCRQPLRVQRNIRSDIPRYTQQVRERRGERERGERDRGRERERRERERERE